LPLALPRENGSALRVEERTRWLFGTLPARSRQAACTSSSRSRKARAGGDVLPAQNGGDVRVHGIPRTFQPAAYLLHVHDP